jgi:formate dehydrogenase accessory protein FdhD
MTQAQLYSLVNTIRLKETTYKSAGSVHACALFAMTAGDPEMLLFVEDVGRHNAIDTIAGWMSMQNNPAVVEASKVFYTTGRLTSEMVIKSAQMGVPIVVSRSGITQMGTRSRRPWACAPSAAPPTSALSAMPTRSGSAAARTGRRQAGASSFNLRRP